MDNPLETLLPEPGQPTDQHTEAGAGAQPETQAQAAPPAGPARGPDGKFAPKAAEAPAQAEPAPAAPDPGPRQDGHVPLSAVLDEREKRQAAEKAVRDRDERLAIYERQNAQPPAPDEQFQAALYAQNLRVSRRFAEREYGAELIATVHDWAVAKCDADPFFNAQMRSSDDPYGAAFQAYNREQIAAKVTPERLAAFGAWEQAQAQLQGQQPSPATPAAQTPIPRSLATAPGNGAAGAPHIVVGEGEAFRATIPG